MNDLRTTRRDETRRGGFTLVEVVIALAIFVFGALAIIRIFPPALGVIQNSGDRLVAINLNKSLLERYEKQPLLAPDGTFDAGNEGFPNNWRDLYPGSVAGARRNNSLPLENVVDYEKSALGHFRHIAGEKHRIESSITTNQAVTTQFPFKTGSLNVFQEDQLSGVILKADGTLDLTNATRLSTGAAYTAITAGDQVYVSYNWIENSRIWHVDEELYSGTVFQYSRSMQLVAGEVTVRLRASVPTPTTIDPVRGWMVFSNLPAGLYGFDYVVDDWRWLVYDGLATIVPDSPTPGAVHQANLPIRLLDNNRVDYLYTLSPSTPASTSPTKLDNTSPALSDPSIAKTSVVPFDTTATPNSVPRVRIVYRTADNWAQQLSVAASNYVLFDTTESPKIPPASRQTWRECALSTNGKFLYFHPSEAGKTLMVTYSYDLNPTSPNPTNIPMNGRVLTIDTNIISTPPTDVPSGFAATGEGVARLQLTDATGRELAIGGMDPTSGVKSIQQIKGIGIQSRTAWLDGDRFNQVASTAFRGSTD